jgi:hypothetical protein
VRPADVERARGMWSEHDYHFDTFHDGQYLAISWRSARFEGNCILKNQQDLIIADDKRTCFVA